MGHLKKLLAVATLLCLLIEAGIAQPLAETNTGTPNANLPNCVNAEGDIAEIQRLQKTNNNTARKYDGYRDIFRSHPDLELATRLAYAETLAANCPDQQNQIADLTTSVIGNRIRIRGGDVQSVVLQRDQFASSLNIYPESRYRDLLCPRDAELWRKVQANMRLNLEGQTPTAPIPKDAVNYYLYRHSARFDPPAWKLEEVVPVDQKTRECIRVFRNPAWK